MVSVSINDTDTIFHASSIRKDDSECVRATLLVLLGR